tara:strand:- start:2048 stop:2989 length:942 start_codon:yes stop_codon:yes gene_type:complete
MRTGFKTIEARNERYEGIINKNEGKVKEYERSIRAKETALNNKIKKIKGKRGWSEEDKAESIEEAQNSFEEYKKFKLGQLENAKKEIVYYNEAKNSPLAVFEKKCELFGTIFRGKNALEQYEAHTKSKKYLLRTGQIEEYWDCKYCGQKIRKTHDRRFNDFELERHETTCPVRYEERYDENGNVIIKHLENKELEAFHFLLNFDSTFQVFKRLNIKMGSEYFLTDNRLHELLPEEYLQQHPKYGIVPHKDTQLFVSEGWDFICDMVGNPIADLEHRNDGTLITFYGHEKTQPDYTLDDIVNRIKTKNNNNKNI